MSEKAKCLVCGTENIDSQYNPNNDMWFYFCPVCGRYQLRENDLINNNTYIEGLSSYFYYNGFKDKRERGIPIEYRYFTPLSKEFCDEYNEKADKETEFHGRPVHYDKDIVKAWMPTTLSEKVDMILLKFDDMTDYMGQTISISYIELFSCLFIKRRKSKTEKFTETEMYDQVNYILDYLENNDYIKTERFIVESSNKCLITILAKGYDRIDELEKKNSDGKIAFVAMSFGEDTKLLRESIREGISQAGYVATFIDEVEHNEFITPEIMAYIRRSRFLVVELTHNNSGAYFEEGYAMGLGKQVIQLCKKGTDLHFDIAQKNTIFWENEEDIPLRLNNRIHATVD